MPSHSSAPYISEQLSAPVLEELNAINASRMGSPLFSMRRLTAVMVARYCSKWNSSGTRNTLETGVRSTGTYRNRNRKCWPAQQRSRKRVMGAVAGTKFGGEGGGGAFLTSACFKVRPSTIRSRGGGEKHCSHSSDLPMAERDKR